MEITKQDLKVGYLNRDKSRKDLLQLFNAKYTMNQIKHLKTKLCKIDTILIDFIKNNINNYSCGEIDIIKNLEKGTAKIACQIFNVEIIKNKKQSYSKKELDFIKNNYDVLGRKKCSEILGVSETRIRQMTYKLNLKRSYQFSDNEKQDIKRMCKLGYTVGEIAIKYKRTQKTIYNFCSNNNLDINVCKNNNSKYHISAPELYIIKTLSELLSLELPDKTLKSNRSYYYNVVQKYEIDVPIYINNYKFAIEYDGEHWHKDTKEHDAIKDKALRDAGYIVFRISSKEHNNNYNDLQSLFPICKNIAEQILALVKHS